MSEAVPGALDRLVRMQPTQVANFILSAEVVRASVTNAGETLLLLPERGSLPMYWAADGYDSEEHSMVGDGILHLPIGSFDFAGPDNKVRKGSLEPQQKQSIVGRHRALLEEAGRILIIDEVQKGGTITELVGIINRQRGDQPNRLYVVAAQDSRKKVADEPKKPAYKLLATGGVEGVATMVIPMPLIATDNDSLLNQLWYPGNTRIPREPNPPIEIRPNEEAELIFRLFGTAARNREALEDTSLLDSAVFSSLPLGPKSSQRVERWREVFIAKLKDRVSS